MLGRGIAWLIQAISQSLQDASSFVKSVEIRQSYKIGCPEEAALRSNFINLNNFKTILDEMPECEYKSYLNEIYKEEA